MLIKFILVIFVIITGYSQSNIVVNGEILVRISNGLIEGKYHQNYRSFEGIPYAYPPLGELRFEPPQPYSKLWKGIRDAHQLHESCMRWDPMEGMTETILIGSEDCLYINVYVPYNQTQQKLPVMVYIHGGAFMFGSGDDLQHHILMEDQRMILVTFNYRLGPLGFLSTGDEQISGNMGLKDQQLALKWVKQNIQAFGGNPEQILISGFSAGGASVELHLLTPDIDNYVNAAVSFSGSALNPWVLVQNPLNDAIRMSNLLECRLDKYNINTSVIKNCLKNAPAEEIVKNVGSFQSFLYNPVRVFGPVIELEDVENAFITDTPANLIRQGKLSKNIPWLASYTGDDGGICVASLFNLRNQYKLEDFHIKGKHVLPTILMNYGQNFSENDPKLDKYTEKLWKKYSLPRRQFTYMDYDKLAELATDIMLRDTILEAMDLHTQYGYKTYGYIYDIPSRYSWGNYIANRTDISFGTFHGDDVCLILNYPQRDLKKFPFRSDEKQNSKNFINMLHRFITTGVPEFPECPKMELNTNFTEMVKISTGTCNLAPI